jgi:hypothetical protein
LPPFGKRWFRVLRELEYGHPVAMLRLHWIFLNVREDRRLEGERRKEEIEYGGFFANPEVYFKVKGLDDKKKAASANPFGFAVDESDYWRRREAAMRGESTVKARRTDVAEMVRRKRGEMPERRQKEYQPSDDPDDGDILDSDDLIVEG